MKKNSIIINNINIDRKEKDKNTPILYFEVNIYT